VGDVRLDRAGPGGLAYEGAIILTEGSIRFLCTSSYVPPIPYIRTLPNRTATMRNFREFFFHALR
jgi:hypothetical protein